MKDIFMETDRLILRSWKKSDEAVFIDMNGNKEVMRFFPSILSEDETLQMVKNIQKHFADYGYGLFALERKDNHHFIGYTGLSHPGFECYFTPCVEIGWRLIRDEWNLGFATEAATACLYYGFEEINLNEIYSFTSIHNKPSEKLMQKIGMLKEGLFEHPILEEGHYLSTHCLYKKTK